MGKALERWETAAAKKAHRKAQAKYQKSEEQVEKRVNRNKARRHMIAEGKAKVGDGKDVAYVDGNALNDDPRNYAMQSRKKNRSYARTKDAGKKNPRD